MKARLKSTGEIIEVECVFYGKPDGSPLTPSAEIEIIRESPWISLWVRRPKDGERVWVRCKRFNNLPFFYSAGKFHTTLEGGYCAKDVTHWMPIPE